MVSTKEVGVAELQKITYDIDTTISRDGDNSIKGTEIDTDNTHLARVRNLPSSRYFKAPKS